MRYSTRWIALALGIASLLPMAGCSDNIAGPQDAVLIGVYGSLARPDQLMATHTGVELNRGCNTYFSSTEPARLDGAGDFQVKGRWHDGSRGLTTETVAATLSGHVTGAGPDEQVALTLRLNAAESYTMSLQAGATFDSEDVPTVGCPA